MTMASSTTKPTEIVNPISEMLSRLKPPTYMTAKVAISDSGTATLGITVAQTVRKKMKMTTITSVIVSIIVICTSCTAARVTAERSETRSTWTEGGIDCSSCGISSLMRSTSARVFAPGALLMAMPSAGRLSNQAPTRVFCTESMTSPTSLRNTGAPLR